ncbi:ATP-binding protein [Pararobbsia alpina]|uniref:DNA replication protein DnaC n=1 Tax=Pararobbsia alpina TaxID=621374 RepID=A0A6S7B959_9BURK|nr:ATP-binding protein [Pararobbsia alpina]CAB3783315.1 DNA replication protein DnaC [Pararobbsia alpina]
MSQKKIAVCIKHGEFGSEGIALSSFVHWTGCPTCAEERAQEVWAREESERAEVSARMAKQRRSYACIPSRFDGCTFDNYVTDTEGKRAALTAVRNFVEALDSRLDPSSKEPFWLAMHGKVGTGKSHLCVAAINAVIEKHSPMYMEVPRIVQRVSATWRRDSSESESDVVRNLTTVGLLVIDEIGVQRGTEFEQTIMTDILNARYSNHMPTILATNYNKPNLDAVLGDRIADRLREVGKRVIFDWESCRGKY